MRLKELAATSETSAATIKFYLREGLLPPGRTVNARLAEYDDTHVTRLRLIGALRGIVQAPIADIATLLAAVDDPDVPLYDLLGQAQMLGLGISPGASRPSPEPADLATLLGSRDWTTQAVEVRAALAEQLASMREVGIEVTPQVLDVYADAADSVARLDLGNVAAARSRDEAVLVTVIGVHTFGHLLLRLVAVAQASHAQRMVRDPSSRPAPRPDDEPSAGESSSP